MRINFKNIQPFLLPLLVVILIFTFTFVFLKPKFSVILKTNRQLVDNKKVLANLTNKLNFLQGLAKVELTDKTNLVLDILPAEKDVPRNLFTIRKVAYNNGLIITGIDIAEVGEISTASAKQQLNKNEILPSLLINIAVNGNIEQVKNFITQLESTSPLMKVNNVLMTSKKEGLTEVIIDLKAFFLSFPESIGKSEQPLSVITSEEEKVFAKIGGFTSFKSEEIIPNLPVGKENLFTP